MYKEKMSVSGVYRQFADVQVDSPNNSLMYFAQSFMPIPLANLLPHSQDAAQGQIAVAQVTSTHSALSDLDHTAHSHLHRHYKHASSRT